MSSISVVTHETIYILFPIKSVCRIYTPREVECGVGNQSSLEALFKNHSPYISQSVYNTKELLPVVFLPKPGLMAAATGMFEYSN